MSNVKEIKEALALAFSIARIVKGRLADGYQTEDLLAILEDLTTDESLATLKDALDGAANIPAEAGAVGLFETIELVKYAVDQIKTLG